MQGVLVTIKMMNKKRLHSVMRGNILDILVATEVHNLPNPNLFRCFQWALDLTRRTHLKLHDKDLQSGADNASHCLLILSAFRN